MFPSSEALLAFAEAAKLGSFSAAALKLGKGQSTISTAIANLEIDFGLVLFDRSGRKPTLTQQGEAMLRHAEDVLRAYSRLDQAANAFVSGHEPRLSVALSDTYQSDRFEEALNSFGERFPETELECLIAECDDLVTLIQSGRAQIGFVEQQQSYPADICARPVPEQTEIALYVARSHPLAEQKWIQADMLLQYRELRLSTVLGAQTSLSHGRSWSAPSYLMLMEMAQRGFGWAALPRWLVERFGRDSLYELRLQAWPRNIVVDAVCSRRQPLGPAGAWLLETMLS